MSPPNKGLPIPSHANRAPRLVRGLTGDYRQLLQNQPAAAQLIDAEWAAPAAWLITGTANGAGNTGTWTLRTGIDRAVLVSNYQVTADSFSIIVVARSISLSYTAPNVPGSGAFCEAIAVPVDLTFNATDYNALQFVNNGLGGSSIVIGATPPSPHNQAVMGSSPVSVVATQISPGNSPVNPQSFVHLFNYSPGGRSMYVRLGIAGQPAGTQVAALVIGTFTTIVPPMSDYETPAGFTGSISIVWDGADALGFCNATIVN